MLFFKILLTLGIFRLSKAFDAGEVYSILSSKLDVINDEMTLLRQELISTQKQLETTQADLESTQDELANTKAELDSIKLYHGITEGRPTIAPSTISSTEDSTTDAPGINCCSIAERAIQEIKREQNQMKTSLENLIESKVRALNDEIANNTFDLQTTDNKLTQLTADLHDLSNNQTQLSSTVNQHLSDYTDSIVNADYCQSGNFTRWKNFPVKVTVEFDKPFNHVPVFTMGTSLLDFHRDRNLRLDLVLVHLSKTEFTVNIKPWDDTVAYGVGVRWMACPSQNYVKIIH